MLDPLLGATRAALAGHQVLDLLEGVQVDDRRMLAGEYLSLVEHPAGVEQVAEQMGEAALAERPTADRHALAVDPGFVGPATDLECAQRVGDRALLQVERKDGTHLLGLSLVDQQLPPAGCNVVAQRRSTATPLAQAFGRGHLVADALDHVLALELGEADQDVQHQPAHGRGGVEVLGHGDEGDLVLLQDLEQTDEVGERAGQAVELVDRDHLHLACFDVGQQALQGWALGIGSGEAAVVVAFGADHPALAALTGNELLAALTLRIQAVEFAVEAFVGALAAVDGHLHRRLAHALPPRLRRPKNRWPFQRDPVTALARALRLR